MSDLVGTHIVGFPTRRLMCITLISDFSQIASETNTCGLNELELHGNRRGVARYRCNLKRCNCRVFSDIIINVQFQSRKTLMQRQNTRSKYS